MERPEAVSRRRPRAVFRRHRAWPDAHDRLHTGSMIQFTVPTDLPCTVDTFWARFVDTEAVVKTFRSIGFTEYEILEVRDEPGRYFRKVEARPPLDVPAGRQKIIG